MEVTEMREIVSKGVREEAARKHAQYPQYEGHWDGDEWVVVRFKRSVRTKMGLAFEKGELTIAKAVEADEHLTDGWFAYSLKNRIDTWVRKEWAEVV